MSNKYVIIVDHSAGNESVGEMWKETHIVDGGATLNEIMEDIGLKPMGFEPGINRRKNIVITYPEDHT